MKQPLPIGAMKFSCLAAGLLLAACAKAPGSSSKAGPALQPIVCGFYSLPGFRLSFVQAGDDLFVYRTHLPPHARIVGLDTRIYLVPGQKDAFLAYAGQALRHEVKPPFVPEGPNIGFERRGPGETGRPMFCGDLPGFPEWCLSVDKQCAAGVCPSVALDAYAAKIGKPAFDAIVQKPE